MRHSSACDYDIVLLLLMLMRRLRQLMQITHLSVTAPPVNRTRRSVVGNITDI